MKKALFLFVLLTSIFTTTTFAQSVNFGMSYSTFTHGRYSEIFNNKTVKSFNANYSMYFTEKLGLQYRFYFTHYSLTKPELIVNTDTLSTTTGLRNFGIDFGGIYNFFENDPFQAFVSGTMGYGYFHAKQTTRDFNVFERNVGDSFIRISPKVGLKYSITEKVGIILSGGFHFNYYGFSDFSIKSYVDNRSVVLQSTATFNFFYNIY